MPLKKLALCKFVDDGTTITTNVFKDNDEYQIVFSDDTSVEDFRNETLTAAISERCLNFMYSKTVSDSKSLVTVIRSYRNNNLVKGSDIKDKYLFKLYSKEPIHNDMKDYYQVRWIDYEKQLDNNNEIYDSITGYGLFSMTYDTLCDYFNDKCADRYGTSIFILKPVTDCMYIHDGKEVIGDRYIVIKKIYLERESFKNIQGLIESYHDIYETQMQEQQNLYETKIHDLRSTNYSLSKDCERLASMLNHRQSSAKYWKMLMFLLGSISAIILTYIF